MANITIKVRALTPGTLDKDLVVVKDDSNRMIRVGFNISPFGTADADVVTTVVDQNILTDVATAIVQKKDVIIVNNPEWEDVKTDADGDGVSDEDGTRYNWTQYGHIYEIVM